MANISFDPKEIAPLLKTLGLGDAPNTDAPAPAVPAMQQKPELGMAPSTDRPPVDNMPPPKMPPVPAAAGFDAWSNDPQNQAKVLTGITAPGQSLVPASAHAQFGGVAPLTPPPATPPAAAPTAAPAGGAPPVTMAADMAANPNAYQQNSLKGRGWGRTLAVGGVAALQSLAGGLTRGGNPLAGMGYLDQQIQHDDALPATNAGIYDVRNIKPLRDAAALADTESQTRQRNSAADKSDSAAEAGTPFVMTANQAAAIGHPELAGMKTNTSLYTKALTGSDKVAGATTVGAGHDAARVTVGAGNNATAVTVGAGHDATSAANNTATNKSRETVADMSNKTHLLMTGMNNATSRANNDNTNTHKGGAGGAGAGSAFKVPADVTKRAALATNVNENADGVEEIIRNRPDIVGKMGGRYTNVQQMIGSDDPDIQALGVRVHNIALAGNGAHGVRSAEAVAQTEHEIFNGYKTGPNGIMGALKATRGSVQTFLNDEKSFQTTGSRNNGGTGAPAAGASGQAAFKTGGGQRAPSVGAPPEGTRKQNSHGDNVVFHNGAWGPA